METPAELRQAALLLLRERDVAQKAAGVHRMAENWRAGNMALDAYGELAEPSDIPGQPDRPSLIAPMSVKRRKMSTPEGRAAMIHALVHIEFNAINLALDAVWRFAGLPEAYYADWLKVADEEALHFSLLAGHLQSMGYGYGDFPAHNGLWEVAARTSGDVLARMALVPRTLEARGLDAVPVLRAKLLQAGDEAAGAILDIILRDEIGHVGIGNRWYGHLCRQRGMEPVATYRCLAETYSAPLPRGPFNLSARQAAGFSEAELADLVKP
ncbi:MAG: ferritin-like domain-containing protein [Gallionella sp.]|nr:ferritin-like domain-containing protein [Gallionella sp.]MDD4946735.1 ferritin-like domain-containing protein [Gallionella sp.]MDD5612005.1 ferritin-like domain-containing protein [Gallionella sp.]